MRGAGFEAFFIAYFKLATGAGTLLVDATGDLLADLPLQVNTTRGDALGAGKADSPRGDLDELALIKSTLLRLLPVEGDAVVAAAGTAG